MFESFAVFDDDPAATVSNGGIVNVLPPVAVAMTAPSDSSDEESSSSDVTFTATSPVPSVQNALEQNDDEAREGGFTFTGSIANSFVTDDTADKLYAR